MCAKNNLKNFKNMTKIVKFFYFFAKFLCFAQKVKQTLKVSDLPSHLEKKLFEN